MLNSNDVERIALEVGFDACGIARADALTDEEYPLRSWLAKGWLAKGWHAGLSYMERNVDMRMDPRLLVPGARSVICCVSAYPPPSSAGGIAAYARTREYHKVIKDMLHKMLIRLGLDTADGAQNKICCDTVPISDKHWAARAGLGFIGRHTLLVTPQWGTWVNLGEIVTTEECTDYPEHPEKPEYPEYPENPALPDFCSHCRRCVDACPNHAIAPDGPPMIDVSRCTAYYTTHHSRPIPPGHITAGYTQGCDLCQLACPHNNKRQ